MDESKRRFLRNTLYGAGLVGLRALATGLPIGMLVNPRKAAADTSCQPAMPAPQYLIWSTSGRGDPLNANVPGMFNDPGIYHSPDAQMAATPMTVGGATVNAAKPWTTLSPTILSRTCFFHHGTYTNGHGDAPKVNAGMGAIQRNEMLVSLIAKTTGPALCTVQQQPAVLSPNLITFAGSVLSTLSPPNLQSVLAAPNTALNQLQAIRDNDVNSLNALFKSTGNKAQSALLDQYALSQSQARNLSQTLLTDLSSIKGAGQDDQSIAAAVLLKMNVTPVCVVWFGFGDDNHSDPGLATETSAHVASMTSITNLMALLTKYGIQDNTTIAFQNVFGRTLNVASHGGTIDGRNHNSNHHCTVIIGKGVKSSLIGGAEPNKSMTDYQATGIDSVSGSSSDGGDIPYENTLGAVGKTLGVACGVPQTIMDTQITQGKVVQAALA